MSAPNRGLQPNLTQWSNSSVQAKLIFDKPAGHLYTNLDVISGKLVVRCLKDVAITAIVVKLEGESRTRLQGQTYGTRVQGHLHEERRQDPNVQLEHHKILYKLQTVFPPSEIAEARSTAGKNVFTLSAGIHEYPWQFKIPFNNACYTPPVTLVPGVQMGMSSRGFEVNKIATRHVKTTLPPTLTGFPGEAEIAYFVKATVQRQGLFNQNARSKNNFQFMPIENPRPTLSGEQLYARQQHTFFTISKRAGKKAFTLFSQQTSDEGPSFGFDMRLPKPAILTCDRPLPLSIVITKLNDADGIIYLRSLQISLIGSTRIRTHEFERTELNSWIILSKANMSITAVNKANASGTAIVLDDELWRNQPLPNSVAPTFMTCNITRTYQVEVRAGFAYADDWGASKVWKSTRSAPQQIVLSLKLDAAVYSGIVPPQAALERLTRPAELVTVHPIPLADEKEPLSTGSVLGADSTNAQPAAPALPARPGEFDEYADAPPSYEDAMASDLPPVDGYRPAYAPPPAVEDRLLSQDEKKGWLSSLR